MVKKELIQKRSKAIEYLDRSTFKFDYVYLYTYLGRSFSLPPIQQLSQIEKYSDSLRLENSANSKKILKTMSLYKRLVDPAYTLSKKDIQETSGLDSLMLTALYSDRLSIDTLDFYDQLKETSNLGQYNTTHSLLSIIFLEENKCIKSPEFYTTKKYIQDQNIAMLNVKLEAWDDIKIESLALLLHSGAKVKPEHIQQVLQLQNTDGGWAISPEKKISDPHTTILAVWILTLLIASK